MKHILIFFLLTACVTNQSNRLQKLESKIHALNRNFANTNYEIDRLEFKIKKIISIVQENKTCVEKIKTNESEYL